MWAFLIASALLLAGLLTGLFADNTRTWGFHFLRYYPASLQVAFILAGLLAAALVWQADKFFSSDLWPTRQSALNPLAADLVTAILCALIFFLFRAATPVLGDGQLWINELGEGSVPFWDRRGPLTLALYDALFQFLNSGGDLNPQNVFLVGASLAGGITVFVWLRAARALGVPIVTALPLAALWGGIAQFFGYVELYAPMIAIVSVMLALIVVSLRRGTFCWMVPILALAAPWFHFIALTFLPAAALYVWWGVARRLPRPRALVITALALLAVAGILYFVLGWHRGTNILLPLWPQPDWSYAVFSPTHLLDLANGIALSVGVGVVLLFFLRPSRTGDEKESPLRTILIASLLFPCAAYVMHNPQLGMARDWDIGAALLCAIPFALFLGGKALGENARSARFFRSGAVFWLCVIIVPWLGVQASESRSIRRFEDLLRLDREQSATGWDYLGGYWGRRGDLRQVGRCYEEAAKLTPNIRYHRSLAIFYASQRDWQSARREAGLVADSVFADSVVTDWESKLMDFRPFLKAAGEFLSRGDYDSAHQMYLLAAAIHPQSLVPYLAVAALLIRAREFQRAEDVFRELLAADSTCANETRSFFAALTRQSGSALEEHIGLAIFSRVAGNLSEAQTRLAEALALAPADALIKEYLQKIRMERKENP